MNTTITALLYTSKILSNGEHPLMLRLTKSRKIKYRSLHISLNPKFWDFEKNRPKRNCPDRERILNLIDLKTKELQEQVIEFKTNDKAYTLNTLITKASKTVNKQTVGEYLESYINKLLNEDRIGNAKTFKELRNLMIDYCRTLDFYFIDIDLEWLRQFEQWMRMERKLSPNTMGIRFRSLRVLYNNAVTDKLVKQSNYPFDEFKVSQFKASTAKRSISKEDIKRLIELNVSELSEHNYYTPLREIAKDIFLFSYFCCGINMTDIMNLKYENVIDGRLTFSRQKTGKLISFQLQPFALQILNKYTKSTFHPKEYIFPIIDRRFT